MDIELLLTSTMTLASGIPLTLILTLASLVIGLLLSIPLAFLRASGNRYVSLPVLAYTYVFRGTPLLVQLFIIYYGLGQIDFIRSSVLWYILRDPFWCSLLAFSLNSAAYTTEVFRGGILAVPPGMIDAAQAIGMTPLQQKRKIVLPIAFRGVLPSYVNEVIALLKASSLASTVTLLEITGLSRKLVSETFAPYEIFIAAGILYLGLTSIFTSGFRVLETRWLNAPPKPAAADGIAVKRVAHGS